jgi:hypothetical protein
VEAPLRLPISNSNNRFSFLLFLSMIMTEVGNFLVNKIYLMVMDRKTLQRILAFIFFPITR